MKKPLLSFEWRKDPPRLRLEQDPFGCHAESGLCAKGSSRAPSEEAAAREMEVAWT